MDELLVVRYGQDGEELRDGKPLVPALAATPTCLPVREELQGF